MEKLKIIYYDDTRGPEIIQAANQQLTGEWIAFSDGSGLVLQVRAADVKRIERAG